ncbi:demethylmenaquinone methyltransferase / 2-methoxy-6-polyprenyl-1,4-benzoquinol methylase [Natronoarchaeum philippinense]|uniref:Demethylmenaquinone methyltransferase / 2-methoxy-6-polyprenyl-1,4-benzoquinol methylase n=1 Tax=Natronoarchaeum philippinense TaxID=558529 RepID=A0A285N7K1_NATPI|nr:demethylmenaquinone methyltransferase / 2-methoxy-6-polyprenyl-1,4-benzoquinol methylase [Natronoarchaeum philippinense]
MVTDGDVRPFDRFAPAYDLVMPGADAATIRQGLAVAERDVRVGIDVAGGTGRAARAVPEVDWTVVDAAAGMLRVARRRGVDGVGGDAARLPIADESVDAVTIVDALHHVGRPDDALAEAARVLAPGGVLVVCEFNPGTLRGKFLTASERLVGFDSQFWRPEELAARVELAGLEPYLPELGFGYAVAGRKPADR